MASVDQALDTANHLARECDTLRREVERLTKERDAARTQVERLRGIMQRAVENGGNTHAAHECTCPVSPGMTQAKCLSECNCWVHDARAALADAAVRNDDPDAPNERR